MLFPTELIDNVVAVAEHTADELIRTDGREVQLEEDAELQLPFLLPEDGYSCDIIRGVPQGLQEFLQPLEGTGRLEVLFCVSVNNDFTIFFCFAPEIFLLRQYFHSGNTLTLGILFFGNAFILGTLLLQECFHSGNSFTRTN